MLKSAGYGSARARANRNNRVEEAPALELPPWFRTRHISLYEQRPLGVPATQLPPLKDEAREQMLAVMERDVVDKSALTEAGVEMWKAKLSRLAAGEPLGDDDFHQLWRDIKNVHTGAFWQTLLLTHHPEAEPGHIERLRQHYADCFQQRALWWALPEEVMADEAQRWFSNVRFDAEPGSGLHISPLGKRGEPEYHVCMELLAAVQSQLRTPPATDKPESRRPPTILSILKGKGRSIANSVVDDIATDLKADVVHLNAQLIARLVGRHLGLNPYSARGSLSMLGYAAAEMNGRLALRPDPDSDHGGMGMVNVELPSQLRTFLSRRDTATLGLSDGRWDDMKLTAALETLVSAVDQRRDAVAAATTSALVQVEVKERRRDLIIHLHDYVELSSLYPAIIQKLRALADRLWTEGRRVVLVGSSSGDPDKSLQWRDQLMELGQDGAHVIPFHAADAKENRGLEKSDNIYENLYNIEEMIRAMVGDQVPITFTKTFMRAKGTKIPEAEHTARFQTLASTVYDAQWVSRLASLMVGGHGGKPRDEYDPAGLNYAMKFMLDRNKRWANIHPSVGPPYFSPLSAPRNSTSSSPSSSDDPTISSLSGAAASKEYTAEEKKLLSGLINAKDIHTTFADIVVPQETKESLIGLTTLSLIRPEAFSYGVLKTEHISGCLLYGPPGTGKTLLAKAVAKESGANMLEVSAADINDKWVGASEKNVQSLFSLARKLAPCVIFLDEADALLAARRSGPARAAYRETITQFLREWDGLTGSRAFIMVATNRPFDLDEAVLRRLPRKILVDLPLTPEREAILRVMLREETLAEGVDVAWLAAETELYSGSDLKHLCVSAAMEAVREEVRAKEVWERGREEEKAEREKKMEEEKMGEEGEKAEEKEVLKAMEKAEEKEVEKEVEKAEKAEKAEEKEAEKKKEGEQQQQPRGEYQFPERRVLEKRHFDKGLREISASISGDMESLKAIRKFDGLFGDAGRKRRVKRGMGFEVDQDDGKGSSEEARVRQVEPAAAS
jgi:SpoVK/Ycf46/Vps4 family AAA+-type ATPase